MGGRRFVAGWRIEEEGAARKADEARRFVSGQRVLALSKRRRVVQGHEFVTLRLPWQLFLFLFGRGGGGVFSAAISFLLYSVLYRDV